MVFGFLSSGDDRSPGSVALYTNVFKFKNYIDEQKAIAEEKLSTNANTGASTSANTNSNTNANINADTSTGGSTSRRRSTNKIKNIISKYMNSDKE